MAAGMPTKSEREDALLLANMILVAVSNGEPPPIVTDNRLWLLAATLRYVAKKAGPTCID